MLLDMIKHEAKLKFNVPCKNGLEQIEMVTYLDIGKYYLQGIVRAI